MIGCKSGISEVSGLYGESAKQDRSSGEPQLVNGILSIVIVNYNAGGILADCVASIISTGNQVQIIVVDNASSDSSLDCLTSSISGNDKVSVIKNDTNLGFSAACNIGVRCAVGEYLLFLNPDCIVHQEALLIMMEAFDESPSIGMVGGLILNPDATEQAGCRRAIPTPMRALMYVTGLSRLKAWKGSYFSDFRLNDESLPEKVVMVEAISGACMMVRRSAMEDVGLLDEGYFMHCEDLDWCMRFRNKGWGILFSPSARVTHYKGTCSESRPIFVEWNKHKGMVRFYYKYFRHQYPVALLWLVSACVWLRFGLKTAYLFGSRAHGTSSRKRG